MTKQEYMAMSLPYGLKCFSNQTNAIYDIISISFWNKCLVRVKPNNERDFLLPISRILPILRPLSNLTKEIEHKGENFVPIVEINKRNEYIHAVNGRIGIGLPIIGYRDVDDMDELPTWLTQFLVELHFDIADLISKGEAIDVNTLDINPYK